MRIYAKQYWHEASALGLALISLTVFVATIYGQTKRWGFPIDDPYIYAVYARQIALLEPFSYFAGSGYSAGATSPIWPVITAPLWLCGFRGELFPVAVFTLCCVCHLVTTLLATRLAFALTKSQHISVAASVVIASNGTYLWCVLAGMETGVAILLLFATCCHLQKQGITHQPSLGLVISVSLLSLSRPEFLLLCGLLGLWAATKAALSKNLRGVIPWASTGILPVLWLVANKLCAGQFMPNTGVAKSHFHLPQFTWNYWLTTVCTESWAAVTKLFWSTHSPLVLGKLVLVLLVLGFGKWCTTRKKPRLSVVFLLSSCGCLLLGVIASSGAWSFHNYRYIAPVFPCLWLLALSAFAFVFVSGFDSVKSTLSTPTKKILFTMPRGFPRVLPTMFFVVFVLGFFGFGYKNLRRQATVYAQGIRDSNAQVVRIGQYIDKQLPKDSVIALHDAGAIAYYGNRPVFDVLGLVTNRQAVYANHGPGSRFEMLENIPKQQRPSHFAYYPGWLGTHDFFHQTLLQTPLPKGLIAPRFAGGANMRLYTSTWRTAGSGHGLIHKKKGWHVVDRLDVADLDSEKQHDYSADLGPRTFKDPTARWSAFFRDSTQGISDGGRPIRGKGGERFSLRSQNGGAMALVVRTGGTNNRWSKVTEKSTTIMISVNGKTAVATVPSAKAQFDETWIPLPGRSAPKTSLRFSILPAASGSYRTYHYRTYHYFFLEESTKERN